MAGRNDQGLQISLIIFVVLFVVFAAMSYLFYKSSSDAKQQIASLESQKRDTDTKNQQITEEMQKYRQMMGFGEVDNAGDIQKTFEDDMKKYGSNFDESRRSYREILSYIFTENKNIETRAAAATADLKELKDQLLAVESQKEKQVVQFQDEMKKSAEDAAGERNRFKQDRDQLEKTKRELSENLDKQRSTYEGQIAERDAKSKDLNDKLTKSEHAKENLMAQVSKSSETFDVADGRVSWVNQDGTVWINLGEADSLRRQINFAVYDVDQSEPAKSSKKGSIEVTRILGDHLAEARVTEDDAKNPILSGDEIYSQVWHRGKKLRFALTGVIDLDGDGVNDMKLARDLIDVNGGVVDAYLGDDGKVEGEITVNTRYLVLGKFPEGGNQGAQVRGWQQMNEDAKTNGVEVIPLDKFLNQVGYVPENRTINLGAAAKSTDFPVESTQGTSPKKPAQFRSRTPMRAGPVITY